MKHSIRVELERHILDLINDRVLTNDNIDDWHSIAFNDDYYIIGYYDASRWLEKHGLDAFESIAICQEYERDNFGELIHVYDNSETTVNMLTYIYGEELLNDLDSQTIEELKEQL